MPWRHLLFHTGEKPLGPQEKQPGKQRRQRPPAPGNGVQALIKELWQAAVKLRGSIEPADYKRYVLPIIFLRFLSLRDERRRAELEKLIADPASDYHTTNPKVARKILDDPDEYRSVGAFIVPEEARWQNIVKAARATTSSCTWIPSSNCWKTPTRTSSAACCRASTPAPTSTPRTRGLINLFSKDIFQQDHGNIDLIGEIYMYFMGEFASSEGKRGGEYFTPISIVRLLVRMLEPTRASSSTRAAVPAVCSCSPTSLPNTAANCRSSARRARISRTACAA